jgi:hypothetical protein
VIKRFLAVAVSGLLLLGLAAGPAAAREEPPVGDDPTSWCTNCW